jgi:hypothetical protein
MSFSRIIDYIPSDATSNEVILTGQLAHLRFMQTLDISFLHHELSALDFIPMSESNNQHVAIKPGLAHGLWYTLQRLARIVLCASNDYNPNEDSGPLPTTIPAVALEQLDLPFPPIVHAEVYPDSNPLLFVQSRRFQEILIRTLQWTGINAIYWISAAIRRSGELGDESLWKWDTLLDLERAPLADFNTFHQEIHRQLDALVQRTAIEEAAFEVAGEPRDSEMIVHPVVGSPIAGEARCVTELREFLQSIHQSFPARAYNDEEEEEGGIRMGTVQDLIEVLERMDIGHITGIHFE